MSNVCKREFTAIIIDDFAELWIKAIARNENISYEQAHGSYSGKSLCSLAERIQGEFVTLVHYKYDVGEDDYFEKIDNNFVIFPELFTEV